MAGDTDKPRLVRIAEHLQRHGVEFLVIGGQAAVLHGSPLPTYDVDLRYRRTPQNLERLAEALRELHPTLRGAPPDLPFRLDAQSLSRERTSPSTPMPAHWTSWAGSSHSVPSTNWLREPN